MVAHFSPIHVGYAWDFFTLILIWTAICSPQTYPYIDYISLSSIELLLDQVSRYQRQRFISLSRYFYSLYAKLVNHSRAIDLCESQEYNLSFHVLLYYILFQLVTRIQYASNNLHSHKGQTLFFESILVALYKTLECVVILRAYNFLSFLLSSIFLSNAPSLIFEDDSLRYLEVFYVCYVVC